MDFMADQLFEGRRFRLLTIVDNFNRESLAIRVGQRLTGDDVVAALDRAHEQRGAVPRSICVDNGPEFISKSLDCWAYINEVKLYFSRPGKPRDDTFIESFNGRLRQECLIQNWFLSLDDAQQELDQLQQPASAQQPGRPDLNGVRETFLDRAYAAQRWLFPRFHVDQSWAQG